ncbi:MAG: hypothetical protein K8R02_07240 [Anaerohalosphaeraceae bacterium]|nr:hypothetical protein [Anaerohalosphaeraceae bacterium]
MKDENLEPKSDVEKNENGKITSDDVKFMRLAIEKNYKQFNPDTHTFIMWGVICLICYPVIHFMVEFQLFKWILPFFLSLMTVGLSYILISLCFINRREKKAGFVPLIKKQALWAWIIIMVLHGLTWNILGTVFNNYCAGDPGFLFAILFSIALSITGIFSSKKEGLYGGMLIYIGLLLAFFIKDYSYIILGLATGMGLIIPAIIIQRNYRKQEKENA